MTEIVINDSDRRIQYTATAAQTVFPYDFPIFDQEHLVVTRLRAGVLTTLALTADYNVSGVGVVTGGNVTLVTGATLNDVITVYGNTPVERTTDFNDAGDFFAATLNRELDLQTQTIQQNERDIARSLRLQDGDTSTSSLLPLAAARASKFLAFDANGDPVAAAGTSADLGPVSAFINTLLDDADAATARTTLGLGTAAVVADSTLVHLAGTETITGDKTFTGAVTITDSDFAIAKADASAIDMKFNVDALTGDRTITLPDADLALMPAATQADMESETANKAVPADKVKNNPGVAKAWVRFAADGAAGVAASAISASYNVSGVVHNTTGQYTISFTTAFSSATFCAVGSAQRSGTSTRVVQIDTLAVGTCLIYVQDTANNQATAPFVTMTFHGDQ